MSKFEKAKERLKAEPNDYTYDEAKYLLNRLGYEERNKGKTSGSRVGFYRESDGKIILLRKPHPSNQMSIAAVKMLNEFLKDEI